MKKIHSIKEFVSYCVAYHFFWIILSFIALVVDPPKPDNYNIMTSESNFIILFFIFSGIYLLPLFPLISINKQISTVKILLSFMFISTITFMMLYFQQHYFGSFESYSIFLANSNFLSRFIFYKKLIEANFLSISFDYFQLLLI